MPRTKPSAAAAAAAAQSGSRKLRALALHGSASNSNIMRVQSGGLRRYLGSDVEWFYPDGLELYDDTVLARMNSQSTSEGGPLIIDEAVRLYLGERSDFEKKVAQGKPFLNWFNIIFVEVDGYLRWVPDVESQNRMIRHLVDLLEQQPVDVVVGWSQGCYAINRVANFYARSGCEPPWRLSIQFHPAVDAEEVTLPTQTPVFVVTSPLDPLYLASTRSWIFDYTNVTVLEHNDGFCFPTTPPRATEIYQQLALELRYCCLPEEPLHTQEVEGEEPGADTVQSATEADAATPVPPTTRVNVLPIQPCELAELMLAHSCTIVDVRPVSAARARPFPGAVVGSGLTELLLAHPLEASRSLAVLRQGSLRIVAVSDEDSHCCEYCVALVERFGFEVDRLSYLDGGIRSWELWELENPTMGNEIRKVWGLPATGIVDFGTVSPQELAELLLGGFCTVLDVREPKEARGHAFPGAQKDVSLLVLRRKRHDAARRLAGLLDSDGVVVAVSATGGRCRQYCLLLVEQFGFQTDRVRWLKGGICSWDEWAKEHWEESDLVRATTGLSLTRGRPLLSAATGEGATSLREHSLEFLF